MSAIPRRVRTWIEGLRFPVLVLVTGLLFVVNLFIPDALPFIDEVLLALIAVLLARLKRKRSPADAQAGGEGADGGV